MYKERRTKLMKEMPVNSIVLFFSGNAPYKVGDEKYDFSVDRNFYYLTNLDKENMKLLLVKTEKAILEYLFIDRYDEELAKWVGGRIMPQVAFDRSNIPNVCWNEDFLDTFNTVINRYLPTLQQYDIYMDFTKQEATQSDRPSHICARELLRMYPNMQMHDVSIHINRLRLVKSEDEIKKLKKAISITKEAIENMWKHTHDGICEYELEAYFDFVLKSNNCLHSFPSIVAGGKNATILHYGDNNQKIKNNALVLCDLGAAYHYMNADITRTFPVNGSFTKRQKEIYDIVLRGNRYIISEVKPGLTLRELNQKLISFYKKELKNIGLLNHGKKVSDYYWHGVSHMLGLETHDVTLNNYPLEPGNVITVEPGLYIEEEGIGIRIEDDVLVCEGGCINLSQDIIKDVEDIENFIKLGIKK